MSLLPSEGPAVSPLLAAGLLLAALPLLRTYDLDAPTAARVLEATGASRSRAYELKDAVLEALPGLQRAPGRPARPDAPPAPRPDLARELLAFVFDNPGSVEGSGARRHYSDGFRRHVLLLLERHRDVPLDEFASAICIPPPTLKDWLQGGLVETKPPENLAVVPSSEPTDAQVETLLALWKDWRGSFTAFCRHVQHDWRIPFGHTLIARILAAHGVRFAKRRSGRSPDEDALKGQFLTFFPNAQWVGDGSPIDVSFGAHTYTFNLELVVDPSSGAFTGASVRDSEDGAAVVEAVNDGVATTGATPLSVLLDNKPSNHSDEVKDAVAPAVVERATPYRPQNKAHAEGGFGLFQQMAPALALLPGTPKDLARQLLVLVVETWARTLNHRPRKDRGGRSRVELHLDHAPTADEIAAAQNALAERIARQRRARATLAARQDPLVREALALAFARMGFADPEGEIQNAIARYPLDDVLAGIAVVEGKRRVGSLPDGADARYLLGVVRNIAQEREGFEIALALWDQRVRARDRALDAVEADRERLDEEVDDIEARVAVYVDRALAASRRLDRFFWLTAAADAIAGEDDTKHAPLYRLAARRINATHAKAHRERQAAIRFLAAKIVPIA